MLEILSIYYGQAPGPYPKTWQYRTLIAAFRAQQSSNMLRKAYGPDWKSLKRQVVNGKVHYVVEGGFSLKNDVLQYLTKGRLPQEARKFAVERLREVELRIWAEAKVIAARAEKPRPKMQAA
jgi:hypothetical protein